MDHVWQRSQQGMAVLALELEEAAHHLGGITAAGDADRREPSRDAMLHQVREGRDRHARLADELVPLAAHQHGHVAGREADRAAFLSPKPPRSREKHVEDRGPEAFEAHAPRRAQLGAGDQRSGHLDASQRHAQRIHDCSSTPCMSQRPVRLYSRGYKTWTPGQFCRRPKHGLETNRVVRWPPILSYLARLPYV